MNQYLTFLTANRATFLDDATDEENKIVGQHFDYVKDLLAQGRLILAGRCQNEPLGIVVFEAEDDEEANRLMHADPAVDAGVFDAEVHSYHVALLRGQ